MTEENPIKTAPAEASAVTPPPPRKRGRPPKVKPGGIVVNDRGNPPALPPVTSQVQPARPTAQPSPPRGPGGHFLPVKPANPAQPTARLTSQPQPSMMTFASFMENLKA